MLQTFNCGIGFCIIVSKTNVNKIKKIFSKKFKPYEIGYISNEKRKINLQKSVKMVKKKPVFLYQEKVQILKILFLTQDTIIFQLKLV